MLILLLGDVVGINYNYGKTPMVTAVTFNMASDGGYYLDDP